MATARSCSTSWAPTPSHRSSARPGPLVATRSLAARRAQSSGAVLTPLSYSEPIHLTRGEGVWFDDVDGNRLLDAYNNVPVVGHCHPRVTEAVVRQYAAH